MGDVSDFSFEWILAILWMQSEIGGIDETVKFQNWVVIVTAVADILRTPQL